MNWLWGTPGESLFDFYSLHHVVWFIALTLVLTSIFEEKAWISLIAVMVIWEIFEHWVWNNVSGFPFAGPEQPLNKLVGDTLSDILGYLIARLCIKGIKDE